MWQILAVLWLVFNLGDWVFAHFRIWQFTAIVPTPIFVIIDLTLLLVGLVSSDLTVVLLSILSLGLQLPFLDINWRKRVDRKSQYPNLKVFSWNTLFWHHNEPELADFLHSQDADIYHLQEALFSTLEIYDVANFVETHFPGFEFAQTKELVTISRLPIEEVIKGTNCQQFGCWLKIDVKWHERPISLYNIHMPIPFEIGYIFKPGLFYKYWRIFQTGRSLMTAELEQEFHNNPNPIVITGDFNTIKRQPPIRTWFRKFKDAGSYGAEIFPITLKAFKKLPLWRVDWCLVRRLSVQKYHRQKYNQISDHYPISLELGLED